MNGYIKKIISFLLVIAFLALVRTDAEPTLWQIGMTAILLYEGLQGFSTNEEQKQKNKKSNEMRNIA